MGIEEPTGKITLTHEQMEQIRRETGALVRRLREEKREAASRQADPGTPAAEPPGSGKRP